VLYSALLPLAQAALTESLTLPAGTVAITEAVALCAGVGLPVVYSPSTKALTSPQSWDAGTKLLTVVNWLLAFAGYWSAGVDGYGRVLMQEYVNPDQRSPSFYLVEGPTSIFIPAATVETDFYDVPNQCIMTCSNVAGTFSGSYTNTDPNSPYSTVSRGRPIPIVETVTDAIDAADLNVRAQKTLYDRMSAVERVGNLRHPYMKTKPGDVGRFTWTRRGLDMLVSIQSQEITLGPACLTADSLRKVA
jgi:hypothetical protein